MSTPYDLHASLGYQTTLFSRISERRFEQALTPLGLTRVLWCVLLAAGQQKLSMPSEIADYIGIDRTATSRALRRLDEMALITRAHHADDKRARKVSLTPKGEDLLLQAIKAAEENAAHFRAKLSWYEANALSDILKKLMADEALNVDTL